MRAVQGDLLDLQKRLHAAKITDARVGIRGSVVRGSKSRFKTGGNLVDFDPKNYDLDLFIESDILFKNGNTQLISGGRHYVNSALEGIESSLHTKFTGMLPGMRADDPLKFFIFGKNEHTVSSFFRAEGFLGSKKIVEKNPFLFFDSLK